ncbi:vegetative cell wall protein gp1-like [Panicum miliaceum]|uniref:Vegetative cell wall protein gp1-like n=1 Tax=Panicum miliaceum TaxID=4540 RepID=A0A3L6T8P4_PANMI|nr:vegetative cell wall protein gp1-like [Panicum miliaceum]
MLPAHPPIPYNQLPPPLPELHLPPQAPMPPTMAYDSPTLPQTIPRRCVPFADDEVYNSPLPEPPQVPSKRYETPALGMVPTHAPSPAADVDPPALHQGPLEPSRDQKLSMEYYSQEQHQE